jgi:hypothetical protein
MSWNTTLDSLDVEDVRRRLVEGASGWDIVYEFHIGHPAIKKIRDGTYVPRDLAERGYLGRLSRELDVEERLKIIVSTPELIDEFWSRIIKKSLDECWPCGTHYTRFKGVYKHQIACAYKHGIVDGMFALHSCDNPPCCNPKHLRWGTQQENVQDIFKRGRRRSA